MILPQTRPKPVCVGLRVRARRRMSQTETIPERVRRWAEDGQLYVIAGALSVVLSLLVLPVVGGAGIYCGYRLYTDMDRPRAGVAILVGSVTGLVLPFVFVAVV